MFLAISGGICSEDGDGTHGPGFAMDVGLDVGWVVATGTRTVVGLAATALGCGASAAGGPDAVSDEQADSRNARAIHITTFRRLSSINQAPFYCFVLPVISIKPIAPDFPRRRSSFSSTSQPGVAQHAIDRQRNLGDTLTGV